MPTTCVSPDEATKAPAAASNAKPSINAPTNEVRMGRAQSGGKTNWLTTSFMIAFHLGAVAALFFFTWQGLVAALVLYVLAINAGVGMSYHRLLTHRGYKVPRALEYLMTACGTLALEGGPIFWVATHRVHHQHSDQEGDPHTPREGSFWSHMGWIISGHGLAADTALLSRYAPDLVRDPVHRWLSRWHWVPLTVSGVLLFGGGWYFSGWHMALSLLLWGTFLRVTLGLHATWLVNSATHMFGRRRFETRDDSRNSWWVALVTGGEGWHNNHHAHPVSARHGLMWYEIDPNYYGIWLLSKLHIATNVKVAQFDPKNPRPAGQ
jgi:stearoyl-CoA desaturase (delta-9 desaturase)